MGGPCNLQRLAVRSFNATRDLLETSVASSRKDEKMKLKIAEVYKDNFSVYG